MLIAIEVKEFNHIKFWPIYLATNGVLTGFLLPHTDSGVLFFIVIGAIIPVPVILAGRNRFHLDDSFPSAVTSSLLGQTVMMAIVALLCIL
jgi:hypothetical protein